MADEPEEAPEITARAAGLVLNLGTLHRTTIPALLACGRTANARASPWYWTRWGWALPASSGYRPAAAAGGAVHRHPG